MQLDRNGNLWVLGGGNLASTGNETAGTISIINTTNNQIVATIPFGVEDHPDYLNISGEDLYYFLDGAIFKSSVSNFQIPNTSIISGVDFSNITLINEGDTLIGTAIGNGVNNGMLQVYSLQNNTLTTTLNVGVIPINVYVNP